MRSGSDANRLYRAHSVALAAAGCALALAACGSSGNSSPQAGSGGTNESALVKFATCIRGHGVPGFPDPSTSQGPNSMGIDGYNFNLPSNLNTQSPAYQVANRTCGHLIGDAGGGPARNPAFAAKARRVSLAHAQCMRQHGVPNFPDPIVSSNGQGITVRSGGPGINPRSLAFQQAERICQPG